MKYQIFQIHAGCFDYGINVVITNNLPRAAGYVNKKLEVNADISDFQCLGKIFSKDTRCPIIWIPRYPRTNDEKGTLSHELLHAVFGVMEWAGVEYSRASEEAYTHLLKYLTKQFYEKAKK